MGFRYRLHRKDLPGKPDLVFPKYKKVIFVNGCFWHGHKNCKRSTLPASNEDFWQHKIERNIERDKENYRALRKTNWEYMIVWQCQIKKSQKKKLAQQIQKYLLK
jgi:DNA mismatch endonuclease (patch repair protein)